MSAHLLASVEAILPRQHAASVCLHRRYGLISLWDIMNEFKAENICRRAANFTLFEGEFLKCGTQPFMAFAQHGINFIGQLVHAGHDCEALEMLDAVEALNRIQVHVSPDPPNVPPNASVFAMEARHATEILVAEFAKRKFLFVRPEFAQYMNQDAPFGSAVEKAFPSARFDIKEAGNCLAVEHGTAAVFHLMRAVEWALRALCVDLGFQRVRTKNKKTGKVTYIPLGWSDWETLLNQLESRVNDRIAKAKRGPKKQLYQEFYQPALQEIKGMKDAWRNHVMHTRREYTAKEADAVFEHVRRLMAKLAERVCEC
jgi:hypothetical protein